MITLLIYRDTETGRMMELETDQAPLIPEGTLISAPGRVAARVGVQTVIFNRDGSILQRLAVD